MNLLSEYAILEYLLSLRVSKLQNNPFINTLREHFSTLRTLAIISAKRNMIIEFELNKEKYVLKHFQNRHNTQALLEDDTFEQSTSRYFEAEKTALDTSLNCSPKLYFSDNQSRVVIIEKLSEYEDFYTSLDKISDNEPLRKKYLKSLASTLKKISESTHPSSTTKNILMIGTLKNNPKLWDYYKAYCTYWNNDNTDTVFIHGDLFSRNILINNTTKDIKIIDWELSRTGDKYFDLSIVVSILCDYWLGFTFVDVFYPKNNIFQNVYEKLSTEINTFLNAYEGENKKIDPKKLKTFLIINTQDRCKSVDTVDNLIKNIEQIFP
jgi:5-methylthioribose kinase